MARVVLDGMGLRTDGRGVARTLAELLPLIADCKGELEPVILTTAEGACLLRSHGAETVVVPRMVSSAWEQLGLPWNCRRLKARAVYSHAACAPLWGTPILLHFTDDPRAAATRGATEVTVRERVRRAYQSLTVSRGLRRSYVVVTSTSAIADGLRERYGPGIAPIVVPLGVNKAVFRPEYPAKEDAIFHLGSSEPRDATKLVVEAYAAALLEAPRMPDLVIGGNLGVQRASVAETASRLGIASRLRFTGWLTDEELRLAYAHSAFCVQPSRYEGFGLQALEALACGTPLIVVAEPAVKEVVSSSAIVLEDHRPQALSQAMVGLWRDKAKRSELRGEGPTRASQFGWQRAASTIYGLLQIVATGGEVPATPSA